jgi:hypothetical protein
VLLLSPPAGQERALDKLLRRELGNREDDVWEEVQVGGTSGVCSAGLVRQILLNI